MAKLLLDEPPLLIVPSLANKLGVNEAIILQQFHYWVQKSNKIHDEKKWIYNTYDGWHEQFTFLSIATIRRTITHLENLGILITANYNRKGFDKTKWYSIDYEKLEKTVSSPSAQNEQTRCSNWADGSAQIEQTNTRDYPETTTETNSESAASVQPPEIPKADDPRPPAGYAIEYFETVWGFPNTQQIQDLTEDVDEYGKELTIAALRLAGSNDVKRGGLIRYIEKVLSDWKAAGIETVEQAREEMRQHLSRQNSGYKPQPGVSREHLPDYDAQAASQAPSSGSGQSIEELQRVLAAQKAKAQSEEGVIEDDQGQ